MKTIAGLGWLLITGVACNGVCGLEEVGVRPDGGAGGGGAQTGGAGQGGGSGGDPTTGGGPSGGQGVGGGVGLCGEPPTDNLVVDGGFEDPAHWYPYGVDFELIEDPSCQGTRYAHLADYQDIEYLEGDGTFQPLVDADTVCIAWEYTARVQSPNLYVTLMLMVEGSPQNHLNYLTGQMGLFAGEQSFTHYAGSCELTVPDVIEQLYPRISTSEADLEQKIIEIDSLVIRPIPCAVNTTLCFSEEV